VISSGGNAKNMDNTIKKMLPAISGLIDELNFSFACSKREDVIRDAEELIRETKSASAEHK
jgi:hypothetical protein